MAGVGVVGVGLPTGLTLRTAAPQELALAAVRQVLMAAGVPEAGAMSATLGTEFGSFGSGTTPQIFAGLRDTMGVALGEADAKGLRTVGDVVRLVASR